MRILNISAQKPDSTGSGVYLAEMVRCELSAGHAAAVVAGVDASDEPTLPEGAEPYFVRFNTEALPFNVCGMSDVMPYFGAKSIGPTLQPVPTTQSYCRYSCGVSGPSRMRWPFSYRPCIPAQNLRLQGYSFRLHPARATLTPYTATPRSTTNSAPVVILHAKRMPHMPRRRGNARASAARPPFCTVARRFFFAPLFLMGW